ncbi:ABC transporter substrate-binding protein [Pseudomonas sp. RAC1]|uniref:ABC transporter substrate-binding protein n=1 Tax=Pseudomonas sp. RAC1 TaxID=3064900 RepID=UPI00271FC121|nr:ABC transporter substrate-binding protein [Pseudomonas sp. RAC1]MDV9033038.1 ABC transporter substrate-binding protein [Pseudomonas sp. RAC1]
MKHTKTVKSLAASAILIAACSFVVAANADQVSDIKSKGEMVCGVLGTDEPFSFIADPSSRQIVGYDIDLCQAVAEKMGVKPVLKQLAVSARIPELQQGRVDLLAATLTHTKEREDLIDFSMSTYLSSAKVLTKRSSGISHIGDLAGKRVLTVKGTTMEQNIRNAVPDAQIVSFDTTPQALLALKQGKGVAMVNDESSLLKSQASLGDQANEFVILPEKLSTEYIALGVRKNEPAFLDLVNSVLVDLEKSGQADQLFMKWFGPNSKMKYVSRPFKIESSSIN